MSKSEIPAKRTGAVADGHTASKAPDLFRPPKLSGASFFFLCVCVCVCVCGGGGASRWLGAHPDGRARAKRRSITKLLTQITKRLDLKKIGYTSRFVRVILAQGPC